MDAITEQGATGSAPSAARERLPVLLTVIVPVFNEAGTVVRLLDRVCAAPGAKQIIIVNDGSTDGTGLALAGWTGNHEVVLLRHGTNLGKGRAIRTALEHARGLLTIVQDADLEYDPNDYARLMAAAEPEFTDIVFGSRYMQRGAAPGGGRLFRTGVRALNVVARLIYGIRLSDEATCYKLVPTVVLQAMELKCEHFEFCPEVVAKACRMGLRIREVPISYTPRGAAEGKKIRWQDGFMAARTLWRWRRWSPQAAGLSCLPTAPRQDRSSICDSIYA